MFKLIIVDTANTHTSAMAEALLKKKLSAHLKNQIDICSRGAYASRNAPCTLEVIDSGKEFDSDLAAPLTAHRAVLVTRKELEEANCVVVTDKDNLEIMQSTISPEKVVMLADYHADDAITEIPNPKNHNMAFYRQVWLMLDECINDFIAYLNVSVATHMNQRS